MKRTIYWVCLVFLGAVMLTAISIAPAFAGGSVNMAIDGLVVGFSGQQPFIDPATGRTMIPLRAVVEGLGAQVSWDGGKNSAVIQKNGTTIIMEVGSKTPIVNGTTKYLDAPAVIVGGRTMVPVRFISEAMGCQVVWDGNSNCVNIYTNGTTAPTIEAPPIPDPDTQSVSPGMLPNEGKIQKSLTQEDIQRLQSYPIGGKALEELNTCSPEVKAKYKKQYGIFKEIYAQKYLDALKTFQEICSIDYTKFQTPGYREDFIKKYYSITMVGQKSDYVVNTYINEAIQYKIKNKGYILSDYRVFYQASPQYTSIRTKYIFYQESGSKILEEGSSTGKWYWRDIEFFYVIPFGYWEGNTAGVGYIDLRNLSDPQPYNFN